MHFYCKLIVLSFFWLHAVQALSVAGPPEYCPDFCYCDLLKGLNRADCSAQRLISPNVELPPSVEILDLSGNDITILDNNCFHSYAFLQNLSLAHNAIHTIYLDAFSPLHSVQHIDLGHNRLEYVDERIFETNHQLLSLSLEANKFMSLQNKPLLRSKTLQSLNLRNSQITHIYGELFLALPQLRHLDISQNLMITLNVAAFGALQRLQSVQLSGNRWHCDGAVLKPLQLLRKRGIEVALLECDVVEHQQQLQEVANQQQQLAQMTRRPNKMFERLQLHEEQQQQQQPDVDSNRKSSTLQELRTNIENIWRHLTVHDTAYDHDDDDDDDDDDNDDDDDDAKDRSNLHVRYTPEVEQCDESWFKLCHKYRRCLNNMSLLLMEKVGGEKSRRNTYNINDLNFVFLMGIALGITVVVCIISCAMCVKRCCEARRKTTENRNGSTNIERTYQFAAVSNVEPSPRITALPTQRQRISRRRAPNPPTVNAATSNALVRREYATPQGRDNFLSRLFGRPARHQYYRTINENTATLIRRLSRSNLFNNRLSQHYAEESSVMGANRRQQDDCPASPTPTARIEEHLYNEIMVGTDALEHPVAIVMTPATAPNRPETPPPAYGDIMVNERK